MGADGLCGGSAFWAFISLENVVLGQRVSVAQPLSPPVLGSLRHGSTQEQALTTESHGLDCATHRHIKGSGTVTLPSCRQEFAG